MNRLLKLINFEFNRIFKFLGAMVAGVVLLQMIGTAVISFQYMSDIQFELNRGMTEDYITRNHGQLSFSRVIYSLWFNGPIFLSIAFVSLYIFLIWYRDWFGKNTFIYRLLMLPTERIHLYVAKLCTILLMTLSFVAVQLIALPLEIRLMRWIVPEPYYIETTVREALVNHIDLGILFPGSFTEFVLWYGLGIIAVAVIFTAILFERAYRLWGIGMGIGYCILSGLLFSTPLWLQRLWNGYFYTDEMFILFVGSALAMLALSLYVANYLLRHKIRV